MTRRVLVRTLVLSAMLAAMGGLPARPASAFHQATVHLEATAWFPNVEAEARSSSFGVAGSLVTSDDLGIEDPDVVPGGAVTFRIAQRHTIRIEGVGFSVDGSNRIDKTFTFDGNVYPIGTSVTSEADVLFAGAEYGYDLVHTEQVALGLTLGVRYVSAKASIAAPLLGQEGKGEFQVPLPAVGLVFVLHPIPVPLFSSLALTAKLSGGTIGEQGSFIDADGGIEWLPIPILALRVGYRYFHGEGKDSGDEAKVDLSGPYASLTITF